jgi:hypothetical protein
MLTQFINHYKINYEDKNNLIDVIHNSISENESDFLDIDEE